MTGSTAGASIYDASAAAFSVVTLPFSLSGRDYRIAKQRCQLVLRLETGAPFSGAIFVHPSSHRPTGFEEPIDVLNGSEPFFPMELEDGEVILLAKDRVVEIWGLEEPDDDELRRASARSATLEITMSDGVVHTGTVMLEMPAERPRIVDFLNNLRDRFLCLHSADGIRLINRSLIDRVRPQD